MRAWAGCCCSTPPSIARADTKRGPPPDPVYETAPREAWIGGFRTRIVMPLAPSLPETLRAVIDTEWLELARAGLFADAAASYAAASDAQRLRLDRLAPLLTRWSAVS